MVTCRYFQQGRCINGDTCRFEHPPTTDVEAPPATKTLNAKAVPFVTKPRDTSNPGSRGPCIYFLQGTCKRGVFCLFDHEVQVTPQVGRDARSTVVCSFFLRNACNKGFACPYSHAVDFANTVSYGGTTDAQVPASLIGQEDAPSEYPSKSLPRHVSKEESSSISTRNIGGATITFEAGAKVSSLSLPADFSTISITNIPSGKSIDDICGFIKSYGFKDLSSKSITLTSRSPHSPQLAQVKVADPTFATKLLRMAGTTVQLDGVPVQLSVVLLGGESDTGMNRLQLTGVTCTWFQPSKIAYVEYSNTKSTKTVVDGLKRNVSQLDGRRLTFAHNPTSTWMTIGNISPRTSKAALSRILPKSPAPATINMGQSAHTASAEEIEKSVHESLQNCGVLLEWTATPQADGSKVKATAKFAELDSAQEAVAKLNGTHIQGSSRDRLRVQPLVSIKLSVSQRILAAIRPQLDALTNEFWTSDFVTIKVYDNPTKPYTQIRISGQNRDPVARAKASVSKLLSGHVACEGTTPISHSSFFRETSTPFLVHVMHEQNVTIVPDRRRTVLRLYGDAKQVLAAETDLSEKVTALKGQSNIIVLDPTSLQTALRGGFRRIVEAYGKEKVKMDVTSTPKRVVVDGPERLVAEISEMLHNPLQFGVARLSLNSSKEELCPVCWTPPEEPFTTACGHVYCGSCLVSQCVTVNDFPIRCLGDSATCSCPLTLGELKRILPQNDYESMLETSVTEYIRSHPTDFQYCSTPDCDRCYRTSSITDPRAFTCDGCLATFCTACNQPAHPSVTCQQHKAATDGTNEFAKWKEENDVRDCPSCRTPIEKSYGCNHMECKACRTHICWFCMKTFETGSEVYGHMTTAHRGNWGL